MNGGFSPGKPDANAPVLPLVNIFAGERGVFAEVVENAGLPIRMNLSTCCNFDPKG